MLAIQPRAMTFEISSFLYITLLLMFVWPPYIGVRFGVVYIQPFKIALILFLFLSVLTHLTRLTNFVEQVRTVFRTRVGKWALLFLFYSAIATFASGINSASMKFFANSVLMLCFCLLAGFSFIRNHSSQLPLKGLAVIGGLVSAIAIVEYLTQFNFFMQFAGSAKNDADSAFLLVAAADKTREAYRSQATFFHPLVLAQFLIVAVPFVYLECTKARGIRSTVSWYSLLVATMSGIYLTGSRAAFGVLFVFGAIYLVQVTQSGPSSVNAATRLLRPVLAGVVLISLAAILPGMVKAKLAGASDLEASSTVARLVMLSRTIEAIRDRPFFGWGAGTAAVKAGIVNDTGGTIDSFHMTTGIERGLPALLLLAILQLTILWCGFKRWRVSSDPNRLLIGANTMSLLGFFFVTVILSIDYLMPLAFFLIGVQAALVQGPSGSLLQPHSLASCPQ